MVNVRKVSYGKQLWQQLSRAVLHHTEEVHQLSFDVIVDLEPAWFLAQQHGAAAAKDFDVASEFLWEYGINDRPQICLVADPGNWCFDRLSHAPIQIETAGTVPAVRQLYRPFRFFPAIFITKTERRLSLKARRFFKCITSLQR